MQTTHTPPPVAAAWPSPGALSSGRARRIATGALLLAEAMYLAARFDTDRVAGSDAWWLAALSWAGQVTPLALTIATGMWMLGEPARVGRRRATPPPQRWRVFLVAHFGAFAVFYWLTAMIFDRAAPGAATVVAWVVAGGAAFALGAASLAPASVLVEAARRFGQPMLAGAAVGSAAWAAGQVTEVWWDPLRGATFETVRVLLGLVMGDTFAEPDRFVVGTPWFSVEIAPICSGYQGIGLIWVFVGSYLWFFRERLRFPQALLLLPIGTAAAWITNALRIAALVVVGSVLSPRLAVGGFHAHAGALLFCGVSLGLVAASRRLAFFERHAGERSAAPRGEAEAYLVPLLVLLAAGMATAVLASGAFQPLYPLRVLVAAAALWGYRRHYAGLGWPFSWTAVAIGVLAFAVWLALVPAGGGGAEIRERLAGVPLAAAALWVVFRVLGSVVIAPLAEELAFRGFLLRRLVARDFERVSPGRFSWAPFLVSSFLFGAMHDALAAGTAVGMLYALAMHHRGRVGDAVVAHATTNALVAVSVLAGQRWDLWA